MSDSDRSLSPFDHRFSVSWPKLLVLGLGTVVLITLVTTAATSTAAFDPFNPSWDGTTDLRTHLAEDSDVESELIQETDAYEDVDPDETVAFVIAPDEPYTGADADRVESFVAAGGALVVFENVGNEGNALLEAVNADARVDGQLLRDERHHYRGPKMPIATGVENHSMTDDVSQLTLNHATAVRTESNETTELVTTSDVAALEGENGTTIGSHPVATAEPVGDGRVIVVGDPSITINAMRSQPDNTAFVRALYEDDAHVLLDVSHVADPPMLAIALESIRTTPLLQALVVSGGIGIIAVLSERRLTSIRARLARRFGRWTREAEADAAMDTDIEDPFADAAADLSSEERAAALRRYRAATKEDRIQYAKRGGTGIRSDHDDTERERSPMHRQRTDSDSQQSTTERHE